MGQRAGQDVRPKRLERRHERGLGSVLLDLLFPPRCVGCGLRGAWLCPTCIAALAPPPKRCLHCRRALGRHLSPPALPDLSARRLASLQPARGSLLRGSAPPAIHALKYPPRQAPRRAARRLLLPLPCPPADLLVPVPLHAGRLAERGYNQSALLAAEVAQATGLALDEAMSFGESGPRSPQTGLPARERWANVVGAFAGAPGAAARLVGKRVILLDDVCTTGSTLEAAAGGLIAAGAAEVHGLVLARAN